MRRVDPVAHEQRRRDILGAAVGLFAAQGFDKTSTAQICSAVGMSPGNLFHYFPTKRAIFHGIFELDRAEWDDALAAARADPDPWAALMGVVDKIAVESADPMVAGLVVEVLAQAHHDQHFAQVLAENDRRLVQGIADLIESAATQGIIAPELPPAVVARWIAILTDGLYGRGYPEPDIDRATDVETVKTLIARILRHRSTTSR
jgi:AcrR family transcriptional regulator